MRVSPAMVSRIVIDSNVLVASLSSKSQFHWLIKSILEEKFLVAITDEILYEYEEILKLKYSALVANHFITALKELPNVDFVNVYYNWRLLKDEDDNKFVDCYIASNSRISNFK